MSAVLIPHDPATQAALEEVHAAVQPRRFAEQPAPFFAEPYLDASWSEKLATNLAVGELVTRFREHEADDYPPSQPGDLNMPLERLARRHGPWVYGVAVLLLLVVGYPLVAITKALWP